MITNTAILSLLPVRPLFGIVLTSIQYINNNMVEGFGGDRRDRSALDIWLDTEFNEQYNRQYETLNKLGLLDILPISGEMGVIGIDNKEYPIPSKELLRQMIESEREKYELKISQGFTRFQLTPLALPVDTLIKIAEEKIKERFKQHKLLATKKNRDEPDELLDLDTDQPIFVWDNWRGSDKNGQCQYYPDNFDQTNHNGHSKQEILDAQTNAKNKGQLVSAGWNAILLEPNLNIPRQGKGQIKGKRKQLETNQTPKEYKNILKTDQQYQHEQGLTSEDWLTLLLIQLEQTGEVIDDYQGKGSADFLIESFYPASVSLGYGYWSRDYRLAYLDGRGPWVQSSGFGLRSAVGLGQKLEFGN